MWADKEYDYVAAFEHLVWNIKRMELFSKLTLVLSVNFSFPYDFSDDQDLNNARIWAALRDLLADKPNMELEIVRIAPKEMVCFGQEDKSDGECWEGLGYSLSHNRIVRRLQGMAKDFTIKAAYQHRRGQWRMIDVVLPVPEEMEDEE